MTGCSSKNLSPASVSKEFWDAQKQNRIEQARLLTIKEDTKKTQLYKKIRIKSVDFAKVNEGETHATIPTKLYLKGDNKIQSVEFDTKLDKTDKGWRINMTDTKRSLYFAISKQVTGNFGESLKENLEGIGNILKDVMENFKEMIEKGDKN
jgi:uncharacterized protein YaiL (DUF2058 family)